VASKQLQKLISESLAIEAEAAKEAGTLGYMARALVQATMPHKKIESNEFTRKNGAFSMTMLVPTAVGLPYGCIPRLLMSWITTEAVEKKSPDLELGHSLTGFMATLGMQSTGGRWGSNTRLRDQIERLFHCHISCSYTQEDHKVGQNISIADGYELWWAPKKPDQGVLWNSTVNLSPAFFKEITENPVPVDMRALRVLKKSPLALDLYCWLTYRMYSVDRRTPIPWELLQMQFGSSYPQTTRGKLDFKRNFIKQLKAVITVYPRANVDPTEKALILRPSPTHVPRLQKTTH